MEIFKYILVFFFGGFAGGIAPGLINMSVAKIALLKDKKNGLYASLGGSLVNFIHVFVAILMTKYIMKHTSITGNMLKVGLIVFAVLTLYFVIVAFQDKPVRTELSKKDSRKSFAKGFFIANLNILPIPYFVVISSQLSANLQETYNLLHIAIFSLSAAIGTYLIFYIYVATFLKLGERSAILTRYANYFMAGLMFVLTVVTFFRLYYG